MMMIWNTSTDDYKRSQPLELLSYVTKEVEDVA